VLVGVEVAGRRESDEGKSFCEEDVPEMQDCSKTRHIIRHL